MSLINPSLTSVFVQPSGAGNPLRYIDPENIAAAYSGGGVAVESDFVRGRYVGSRLTQNPGRVSMQVSARRRTISALRDLARNPTCLPNVYLLTGCPPQNFDRFDLLTILVDAAITSNGVSGNIADGTTLADPKLMDQLTFDGGILLEARPLTHDLQGDALSTAGFTDIKAIGEPYCAGACGAGSDGAQEFLMLAAPIAPATIPSIFYTNDGGVTWTSQTIAAITNGSADAVAIIGNRVVVAATGTTPGLFTAPLEDVRTGSAVFIAASTQAHSDVVALDDVTGIAVGAAGRISLTQDGGYSWATLTSPVATALNRVAAGSDKNLVWIVGASGVILRLRNLRTVQQIVYAGVGSDNLTAVAVPRDRTNEVYVGSAVGEIHRSRDGWNPAPVWQEVGFTKPTGGGIVEDIKFIPEARQAVMFVVQSNAATESRVLVDYSGGNMATWALAVGSFSSPANSLIKRIAPANVNYALTVGPVDGGAGFVGVVTG
jgi:hypothetical protein